MSKRIKMVLYGEPGVGKSIFASKAPKPFFICTDGNYEWLTDFGADPDAHVDCTSYEEIKTAFEADYSDYETIVLDLTEDAFKWSEQEYCRRNNIDHVSDFGYGKGYDATRTDFYINICKLIALDKNIILLMHGTSYTEKDRRGIEHTKHGPSSLIPDKLIPLIEGRVRYFLRAYVKDVENADGSVEKKRYLSLVPKPNEFGIIRGVNENEIPQDIPLDFNEFLKAVHLTSEDITGSNETVKLKPRIKSKKSVIIPAKEEKTEEVKTEAKAKTEEVKHSKVEVKPETVIKADVEEVKKVIDTIPTSDVVKDKEVTKSDEKSAETENNDTAPVKEMSNADKLAAIRKKLANMKK